MTHTSRSAERFIELTILCGVVAIGYAILQQHAAHYLQSATLLILALGAARLKLKLPGLTSSMSVNLPFILIATLELSMLEALIIALASTAAQCFPEHGGKPKRAQLLFNLSTMATAVAAASLIIDYRTGPSAGPSIQYPLSLILAAASFCLIQTIPVATIISLTEGGQVAKIWSSIVHLSFPYYVLSAGVTSIVIGAGHHYGWQFPVLLLLVMYGVYRSYAVYFGKTQRPDLRPEVARAAAASR